MSSLRTNYKDDVFTGSRKYEMTQNGDGTVSFTDQTTYSQVGDTYGAAQINETNAIVNNLDDKAYLSDDGAESGLADNDYFPFYDTSASNGKKTTWSNIKNLIKAICAIKDHASSTASTYGAGTGSQFGHVKLSDTYLSSSGAAANSVGASSAAVNSAYTKINNQLKANNNEIYMDYKNGKYGYNTSPSRGADTFRPFNSISLVGQYSSDATISVSSYHASSANEFLLVPITSGNSHVATGTADTPEYTSWGLQLGFTQGTLSLSGNNLSIILPKVTGFSTLTQDSHHYANLLSGDRSIPCNLYYVGTIN